ncbi:MAG: TIGR01906 family membrane protein [Eubacteriales bacterium]|nr:TIGR01906 family membrane protein [Eubacteriales bacterium]
MINKAYTQRDGYSKSGYILGVVLNALAAVCIIFTILITSLEIVCYGNFDFYRQEYEKYGVLNNLPEGVTMSEEDGLMAVTHHMMKYLRGDKDTPDLQIKINTAAGERDFFVERELLHMEDVRVLFIKALQFRYIAVMFTLFVLVYCRYAIFRDQKGTAKAMGLGMLIGAAAFFAVAAIITVLALVDFNAVFIKFHHIFFNNDLWLLDPRESLLINILPEDFFFDIVKRTFLIFIPVTAAYLAFTGVMYAKTRKSVLTFRDR